MRRSASGPSPASERQAVAGAVAGKDAVRAAAPGEFEIFTGWCVWWSSRRRWSSSPPWTPHCLLLTSLIAAGLVKVRC